MLNIYLKEKNIFVRVVSTQKALWINIESMINIKKISKLITSTVNTTTINPMMDPMMMNPMMRAMYN